MKNEDRFKRDATADAMKIAVSTWNQIINIIKTIGNLGSNLIETLKDFLENYSDMFEDVQSNIRNISKLFG